MMVYSQLSTDTSPWLPFIDYWLLIQCLSISACWHSDARAASGRTDTVGVRRVAIVSSSVRSCRSIVALSAAFLRILRRRIRRPPSQPHPPTLPLASARRRAAGPVMHACLRAAHTTMPMMAAKMPVTRSAVPATETAAFVHPASTAIAPAAIVPA
jgi:hypothetical protein